MTVPYFGVEFGDMSKYGPEELPVHPETEERPKPKLTYIAHKMGDDIPGNRADVLRICGELLSPDVYPFAPYLVAFDYLDDSKPEQRLAGMKMNDYFFEQGIIDEMLLCGAYISKGMFHEIELALRYGIPIRCHNPELQQTLDQFVTEFMSYI